MSMQQGMFGFEQILFPWRSQSHSSIAEKTRAVLHHIASTTFATTQGDFHEYDELTFRRLVDLEQRRSLRSGRGFHVLLCGISTHDGTPIVMDKAVKHILISTVTASLRKTDSVGWFLQNLTLGMLLTCLESRTAVVESRHAMDRIRVILTNRLFPHDSSLVLQLYDYLQLPSHVHGPHASTTSPGLAQ